MNPFRLDERLAQDTIAVTELPLSRLLLMDDSRYPWFILVPRRAGLVELGDLDDSELAVLMGEIVAVQRTISKAFAPDKVNVGALGNIVRMLHIHLVARRIGDPAWPGPVWGQGAAVRYSPAMAQMVIDKFHGGL
ncbi:MAG: HIT domain-containing protein [Alphaproteobacteria bacterium]|nr:HIT domain-containing protein [Alphaproteobacteria bacterium]